MISSHDSYSHVTLILVKMMSATVAAWALWRFGEKERPTWEKRRSTVAEVAGHPRYWRAITLGWETSYCILLNNAPASLPTELFPEPPSVVQVLFKDSIVLFCCYCLTLTTIVQPLTFGYPYPNKNTSFCMTCSCNTNYSIYTQILRSTHDSHTLPGGIFFLTVSQCGPGL